MSKNKVFIILVLLIAALIGLSYIGLGDDKTTPSPAQSSVQLTYYLSLDFGNGEVRNFANVVSGEETVFELTQKITSRNDMNLSWKDYGEMGYLITGIGDKTNGEDNNYWQYWVNGASAQVGVSAYILKDGDRVEWKFAPYNE